ncbi:hypothetical protein [Niastella koreensis]|uniref:hypothetical protein n=1 Tax=Niastella koreensis TaxID=354356 RepID=UPI001055A1EF|nr:hypothetical protein [Niastella koreensis]
MLPLNKGVNSFDKEVKKLHFAGMRFTGEKVKFNLDQSLPGSDKPLEVCNTAALNCQAFLKHRLTPMNS